MLEHPMSEQQPPSGLMPWPHLRPPHPLKGVKNTKISIFKRSPKIQIWPQFQNFAPGYVFEKMKISKKLSLTLDMIMQLSGSIMVHYFPNPIEIGFLARVLLSENMAFFVFLTPLSGCGGRKCGHGIKPLGGCCSLMGGSNISKGHRDLWVATSEVFLLSKTVFKNALLMPSTQRVTVNLGERCATPIDRCGVQQKKKVKEIYDNGIQASCKKCRPNCRQTKYTTAVTSSPLTQHHMELYRDEYKEQLK
ncbi:hypothetical protein Fcan01_10093 [Folsomia candida]|uniref:Uncharacterized protein n=1 Tax=Folsomia candida TaxID=158441 RepID=A0A226ECK8_FOLCA|nr:hypothetical protein Fcan01_10093 [Folsomia candida]